ncbi:MAG: endonuclease/exonuclease/phosphatase family protein, partial [Alphaproteobacteria bacterium]|nr:endonuclease/exonuclease/phosphatase family protein [Alphaproteobacteria bacterium]
MQAPGLPPRPGAIVSNRRGDLSVAPLGRWPVSLRLATWNINSVRLRTENVCRLIAEWAPDVVCLQETKTPDKLFPSEAFEMLGYRHRLVHGMKGYNGVAILSRVPLEIPQTRNWCAREDCRHAIAILPG